MNWAAVGAEPGDCQAPEENSGTALGLPHETTAAAELPQSEEIGDFPPPPLPSPISALKAHQRAEAARRRRWLVQAEPLLAARVTRQAVAGAVGLSTSTLWRVLSLAPVRAGEELTDLERCRRLLATPAHVLAPDCAAGLRSPFEVLLQVPEIVRELNRLYVATMGASCDQRTRDRRTGSIATTLKRLGDFAPVPDRLAKALRAGRQPAPLKRYLKERWTPEMEAKLRGPKHYGTSTIAGRRDLTEEAEDGTRTPLQPGRNWVLDDMSSNIPFWFETDPALSRDAATSGLSAMITRHGCAVGRQGLYCWDWASGAWLGFDLIGRLRDAYQASDILRFLRKLMTQYGKPDRIVIERGVWKARSISGWTVTEAGGLSERDSTWEREPMDEAARTRIQDGIHALGVEVLYQYSPRGKPIEGAFNHHQRLVPTFLQPGEAVNIGRHAGEYEWAARQHRRAGDGVLHARELGFIHIDRLADVIWEAMLWEGRQPKARRPQPPLEMLASYLQASPMPALEPQDLAVFLPEKRTGTVREGKIIAQYQRATLDFCNPEEFALLGDGASVEYAFDPAEPTLGAAVYGPRGFLCWARYWEAGPAFSARDRSEDSAVQVLKRYKLVHRTSARLLDLQSLRTVKLIEARTPAVAADVNPQSSEDAQGYATAVPPPRLRARRPAAGPLPPPRRRAAQSHELPAIAD